MASPGRPRQFDEERITKALRIPTSLDEQVKQAALERGISVNVLINNALEDYLERLVPVEELLRTREA